MTRLQAAWSSSRLHRVVYPAAKESRAATRLSEMWSTVSGQVGYWWVAAEKAFSKALQPDRSRILAGFAELTTDLRNGAFRRVDAALEGIALAADSSIAMKAIRSVRPRTHADRARVIGFVAVAWLTAIAVHAALVASQVGVGRWPVWTAAALVALFAVVTRSALAHAWTATADAHGADRTVRRTGRGRVLVITPFPEEGAGYRFRIGQYIPHLVRAGFDVTVAPFFTRDFFRIVYQPGHYLRKIAFFCTQTPKRLGLVSQSRNHDLVFIYREAFPIGPAVIERALARDGGPPIVYDFDDAVFLGDTSEANRFASVLKYPQKTGAIIEASTCVIAGNQYLADYARARNDAVIVIPTCVDTAKFVPRTAPPTTKVPVVGWVGSPTTIRYLLDYADVFAEVAHEHQFVLRVAGAVRPVEVPGVQVDNVRWSLENEVALFNTCDIGVYPLADDPWTRGKCGFKAIQFLASGVPVVASAVGVNKEIVQDGVNGFLARTNSEWVSALGRLLVDADVRARFGAAGRRLVEERYSLERNAPLMIATFERALARAASARGAARG